MPRVQDAEIRRVTGLVTKVSPEDIGSTHAKVLKNYDPDPIGVLSRRPGSHIAELTDHLGDAMDAAWWSGQWGANDVDYMMVLPAWPPMLPRVYDPGDRKPGGRIIIGGGGKVAEGGGTTIEDPVPLPDLDRTFTVAIPAQIGNGNPFNVTITAKKPDATVDLTFSGAVTVKLSSWGTGGIGKTFVQNTAPAAVAWVNGVTTISCTVTVPVAETAALIAAGGTFMKVKASLGLLGRGIAMGESNRGWVTATGYFTVTSSADPVTVGTAFNLTVTAYTAAGAVDTAYATAAVISEDSVALTLSDLGIAAGDWVNGVATVAETLSGVLAVAANLKISVVENGAAAPSGAVSVVVNATVAGYQAVIADAYNEVRALDPNTVYANQKVAYYANAAGTEDNRELYIHLASSVPASANLWALISNIAQTGSYQPAATPFNLSSESGWDVLVSLVTADWDPATLTWNNKPAVTGEVTQQAMRIGQLISEVNIVELTSTLTQRGISSLFAATGVTIYGFRVKISPKNDWGSVGADSSYAQATVDAAGADANRTRALYVE